MTDHQRTPLFSTVRQHAENKPLQFHIPGHKRGAGMDPEFRDFIGYNALSIDLVNISPLDDLHRPVGVINEAQQMAAEAFGADHSFFTVQGTSGAIMTMILTVCSPGDKIIVPRNAHKSIMSAIILAGAKPVFISPAMDERLGIAHGITTSAVRKALEKHPDSKAVVIINPTYFGVCTHLQEIVDLTHSYDIPVLVDEAHGAHIHFHDELPLSAMKAGADMAATSVHKLGGSLIQSSVLNVREGRVNVKRVQSILSMLTTTSTSYLLLSSLDTARRQLALHGKETAEASLRLADEARARINRIPGLYCFGDEILGTEAAFSLDRTKLTVHITELGLNGYEVESWLRTQHNIEVEMSDMYNILCLITPGDTTHEIDLLINALEDLAGQYYREGERNAVLIKVPDIPYLSLTPRDAFYADTEIVPLEESPGRIIAEFIMIYPPGIPILLPGEVVSRDNINYIREHMDAGLPVQGPEDKTLQFVKVIVETSAIS